jgi:hypothetical protein
VDERPDAEPRQRIVAPAPERALARQGAAVPQTRRDLHDPGEPPNGGGDGARRRGPVPELPRIVSAEARNRPVGPYGAPVRVPGRDQGGVAEPGGGSEQPRSSLYADRPARERPPRRLWRGPAARL